MKDYELMRNRGITLIALVVTIIVLLILAGISISMLTGQNGILNRAVDAKEKTEKSKFEENTVLSEYEQLIRDYAGKEKIAISVSDIAQNKEKYYGKEVANYTKGNLVYKIFYIDKENKYGDGTNTVYLKADYKEKRKLSIDVSKITQEDIEILKRMNPKWAQKRGTIEPTEWEKNEKASALLCAPSQWKEFFDEEKANYAIGGSSIEMYLDSYNDVNHTGYMEKGRIQAVYSEKASYGYIYKVDGEKPTISNSDYATGVGTIDSKLYNGIYANEYNWNLASPSSHAIGSLCGVGNDEDLGNLGLVENYYLAPIVSLKPETEIIIYD